MKTRVLSALAMSALLSFTALMLKALKCYVKGLKTELTKKTNFRFWNGIRRNTTKSSRLESLIRYLSLFSWQFGTEMKLPGMWMCIMYWKNALEELDYKGGYIEKIKFPLVDDEAKVASKMYGMMHPQSNSTRDVRGVFVVDPDNIVQAIYFYPMGVGRSTDELLRLIQALQASAMGNLMTPANWQSGSDLLVRIPPNVEKTQTQLNDDGLYKLAWFMWYKKN